MKIWKYSEMKAKVLADCDIQDELFITPDELIGYFNDALNEAEAEIMRGVSKGVLQKTANAVLIKPNQIGTVSQTLAAIDVCKNKNLNIVISHRSGETNDTFICDLAVGTACQYIKAGAPARGERIAKYNRLLEINRMLYS